MKNKAVSFGCLGIILFIFTILFNIFTSGDGCEKVSSDQFGEDWPLTVANGTLKCIKPYQAVIFIDKEGKEYALNGLAISLKKYADIEPIQKKENTIFPDFKIQTKKSVYPLTVRALKLCHK
jgi:hypothetical protein